MDVVTYAAASMKSFELYLGEVESLPNATAIPLNDDQAKQIEDLIVSGKPFLANLSASGIELEEIMPKMEKVSLFFLHSMGGFFFSNFFGMNMFLMYNSSEHNLYFINNSASSSTYSMRNQNPTVKEVFEAVVERAKEYGILK